MWSAFASSAREGMATFMICPDLPGPANRLSHGLSSCSHISVVKYHWYAPPIGAFREKAQQVPASSSGFRCYHVVQVWGVWPVAGPHSHFRQHDVLEVGAGKLSCVFYYIFIVFFSIAEAEIKIYTNSSSFYGKGIRTWSHWYIVDTSLRETYNENCKARFIISPREPRLGFGWPSVLLWWCIICSMFANASGNETQLTLIGLLGKTGPAGWISEERTQSCSGANFLL